MKIILRSSHGIFHEKHCSPPRLFRLKNCERKNRALEQCGIFKLIISHSVSAVLISCSSNGLALSIDFYRSDTFWASLFEALLLHRVHFKGLKVLLKSSTHFSMVDVTNDARGKINDHFANCCVKQFRVEKNQ